jgi:LPXTG-motif cell wall-anchored protein
VVEGVTVVPTTKAGAVSATNVGSGSLPKTGADSLPVLLAGFLLVGLGALLLTVNRWWLHRMQQASIPVDVARVLVECATTYDKKLSRTFIERNAPHLAPLLQDKDTED